MKRWRGQGLVEFALLLPVLLLVIFGIVEAALVIQGFLAVQHAAREAARFAITYQPVQGACLDADGDGHLMDGVDVGNDDADDSADYPACPVNGAGWAAEPDSNYYARRATLIKQAARSAAAGLRIDDDHLHAFETTYENEPGFFGARLWGYPSFQTDCNANPSACEDHPGIEGLPVRVLIVHNVPVVDPFYQAIAEYVTVYGDAQMINEGIQVGFGDVPPPYFETNPHLGEPEATPADTPASTPDETPEATPTLEPSSYVVELDVEAVTNVLPGDRGHEFIATVTDQSGIPIAGARVNFSTDVGGFSYSGVEPKDIEELTNAQGQASVMLYGNRPETANVYAWLDYDGDNALDLDEPYDTATKTWVVSGPYIVASDHEVIPLDYIYIDVMDHEPISNPHRLLWCVISGTATSTVVQDPVNVDSGTGDATAIGFEIPVGSSGAYQIESHWNSGSCGAVDLVAYSASISVTVVPPDLHIQSISWPEEYGDELPGGVDIPFTILVENLSSAPVQNTYFDVDYYLDPSFPPPFQGQLGDEKQWLLDIDPYGTQMITTTFNLAGGTHQLWGQVDTTNYIGEYDETNNVSGPYTLTVACTVDSTPYGDDFNDGSFDGKWTTTEIGSPNVYGSESESGGRLRISGRGGSIWSSSDNFYYVHQSISGDFDARLRVISPPGGSSSAKMGLMVRNSTAANSRHVMFMVRNRSSNNLQSARREVDGGSTYHPGYRTVSTPVWVRIVRTGSTFDYYYSNAADPGEGDWTYRTSATVDMDDTVRVGIAHASYRTYQTRTSEADEFVVCTAAAQSGGGTIKPPGLRECQQVLSLGDFEGNPDRVFSYWGAGGPNAFQHQSQYFYDGSMSLRLHASMGSYPSCPSLSPYLRQTVEIPGDVHTMTTMVVQGQRLVAGSMAPCSFPDTPEADDVLYLQMKDSGGSDLGSPNTIVNGGVTAGSWSSFAIDVTDEVDLYNRRGQDVQIYFTATHDADFYDTWFYLDAIECEVCTEWPVPDDQPGTASIGGDVRVLVGGIPQSMQGVDVWAYSQGGEVYHTVTIHDATYHFYNIPPGVYYIYAEVWVGGGLRSTMTTVTVVADERNYSVNLFLL